MKDELLGSDWADLYSNEKPDKKKKVKEKKQLPGIVPLLSAEELTNQLAKMKEDGVKLHLVYRINTE